MGSLLWFAVALLMFYRWQLLERIIGTALMFLFDAVMWTFISAWCFADPGAPPWQGFSYVMGMLSLLWVFLAGRKYLQLTKDVKNNEQTKSNSGPTQGV